MTIKSVRAFLFLAYNTRLPAHSFTITYFPMSHELPIPLRTYVSQRACVGERGNKATTHPKSTLGKEGEEALTR